MYKIYLKQAWQLIRQERLFSSVYIIGTGLAITLVMTLSIIFYLKLANLYPEVNRDRSLHIMGGSAKKQSGGISTGPLALNTVEHCLGGIEGVEAIGLMYNTYDDFFIQPEGECEQLPVATMFVNTDFWSVFRFHFIEGAAFGEDSERSGIATAVITQSLARRLFGEGEKAVGRYVSLNFQSYRVCGVVEDVSFVMNRSFAQMWMPYTTCPGYGEKSWDETGVLGRFRVSLLVSPGTDLDAVKATVDYNVKRFNQTLDGVTLDLKGQPDKQWQTLFRTWAGMEPDFMRDLFVHGLVFFIFLLVPAVSLSGMADSRMERRLCEMGVRRAFGAPTGTLIGQVITENLVFTLLGGVAGLLLSYALIYSCRDWIMETSLKESFITAPPEGMDVELSVGMLMNYTVFGIAMGVCLVLNLLSSLIPAWRAANKEIVESLNAK